MDIVLLDVTIIVVAKVNVKDVKDRVAVNFFAQCP